MARRTRRGSVFETPAWMVTAVAGISKSDMGDMDMGHPDAGLDMEETERGPGAAKTN